MTEHTQGRLEVGPSYTDDGSREIPLMGGPEGLLFIAVAIGGLVGQEENARRIAATWNACQGIPIEVLEAQQSGGLPWSVADQIGARVDIASLVGALGVFVGSNSSEETITITVRTEHIRRARALIAQVTGAAATGVST